MKKKKKYFMYTLCMFTLVGSICLFLSTNLKKDETVTFFPTYGYYDGDNVVLNLHGWVYEFEDNSILRNIFLKTIDKEIRDNPLFKKRVRYFLVDNERNKNIDIEIASKSVTLSKTKANGHTVNQIKLEKDSIKQHIKNGILPYHIKEQKNDHEIFNGQIHIFSPEGISVISDIDDTIKISNVLDKKELLKNSLMRDFKSVPGMAKTYKHWSNLGIQFHYVSGSPWQLYPEIEKFFETEDFPMGSFHLKYFRIKDSSVLKFLKSDQIKYKTNIIEEILSCFPKRKYILIGDSGEKDAMIYAQIATKYPEQVLAICIRDANKPDDSIEEYQKIFENISCKWIFFKDAEKLSEIDNILK